MTRSNESENSESQKSYRTKIQDGFKPYRYRLNKFIQRRFNRKPAYMITRHGVEVHYFNFSETETLPFDLETYRETQIFIGNWANPWYVDVESIEDEYQDFTEDNITEISDIFGTEHIYPSQRWKTLANQTVLEEMFIGKSLSQDRVVRLMYAAIGGIALLGAILLFGGV